MLLQVGNSLGSRPCVRQSRLYRKHESGNAMKALPGHDLADSEVWTTVRNLLSSRRFRCPQTDSERFKSQSNSVCRKLRFANRALPAQALLGTSNDLEWNEFQCQGAYNGAKVRARDSHFRSDRRNAGPSQIPHSIL